MTTDTYTLETAMAVVEGLPDDQILERLLEIVESSGRTDARAIATRLTGSIILEREFERTVERRSTGLEPLPVSRPVVESGGAPVPVRSTVPDTFTRRAHTVTVRRSSAGGTARRVTRFGRASVMGNGIRTTYTGEPITDSVMLELCDEIELLTPLIDGSLDSRELERLADTYLSALCPPVEHGTDTHEWHQMTRPESGIVATDWNTIHRNPADCHAAAVQYGLISPTDYPLVRDGARPVGAPPSRRLERMPTRLSLPMGRERTLDPTDRRRDDGTLEIVAPTESLDYRFVGFTRVARGLTLHDYRSEQSRRSIIRARSRTDARAMATIPLETARGLILELPVGDTFTGRVNGYRARVSRLEDRRFSLTVWRDGSTKLKADRVPTATRAVEKLEAMIARADSTD